MSTPHCKQDQQAVPIFLTAGALRSTACVRFPEKYFEMKKSHCREALDIYKKFLTRMNKVSELLKVAEQVGIDKGDIPDLTKVQSDERH